jgi:hypothetical protein
MKVDRSYEALGFSGTYMLNSSFRYCLFFEELRVQSSSCGGTDILKLILTHLRRFIYDLTNSEDCNDIQLKKRFDNQKKMTLGRTYRFKEAKAATKRGEDQRKTQQQKGQMPDPKDRSSRPRGSPRLLEIRNNPNIFGQTSAKVSF